MLWISVPHARRFGLKYFAGNPTYREDAVAELVRDQLRRTGEYVVEVPWRALETRQIVAKLR